MDDQVKAMSITKTVASTAEAAYATDQDGRLVAWNEQAERLLGYSASQVLGRRCYEVLRGTDVFGNRFCDSSCPLRKMAGRHQALHQFQLDLKLSGEGRIRVDVSALVFPGEEASQYTVLHLLEPVATRGRPRATGTEPSRAGLGLTDRELQVLRRLAEGKETSQIADALFISIPTVRNHIQHVLRKLRAHSRLEAVAVARKAHLI